MMNRTSRVGVIALLLAGCGGGGSDEPSSVSANPPAPVAATPSPGPGPAPGSTPAPVQDPAGQPPVATPALPSPPIDPDEPPPAASPVVQTVTGPELQGALQQGVPHSEAFPNPGPVSPTSIMWWGFQHTRRLYSGSKELTIFAEGAYVTVGEVMQDSGSFLLPVQLRRSLLTLELNGASVKVREANGVAFPATDVPLAGEFQLDKVAGEWRSGDWFVQLLPQGVDGRPDLLRLCWHVHLPDLEQSQPAFGEDNRIVQRVIPAGPAVRRLQCSLHRRSDGKDVGGKVIDDVAGRITTYAAQW